MRDPAVIRRAVDLGIRYFHAFGNAALAGEALKPVRGRVVLAAGSGEPTAAGLLQDLDKQLRAFKTGHIDLWYLTSKYKPELITGELLEAVGRAKKDGKIRACAIAGHGLAAVAPRLLEVREVIGAAMVVCNFATWEHRFAASDPVPTTSLPGGDRDDIIRLHNAGVGIASMKPMMGGLKYVPAERRPWAGSLGDDERRWAVLSAALKWVLHNPYVDTVPVQMPKLAVRSCALLVVKVVGDLPLEGLGILPQANRDVGLKLPWDSASRCHVMYGHRSSAAKRRETQLQAR